MKVTTTEVDGSAVAQKRGKEGRRGEAAGDP
jgi:hypothetical protein